MMVNIIANELIKQVRMMLTIRMHIDKMEKIRIHISNQSKSPKE